MPKDETIETDARGELPKTAQNKSLMKSLTRGCLLLVVALVLAWVMHIQLASEWKEILLYGLGIILIYGVLYHYVGYWVVRWVTEQVLVQTWQALMKLVSLLVLDMWKARKKKKKKR